MRARGKKERYDKRTEGEAQCFQKRSVKIFFSKSCSNDKHLRKTKLVLQILVEIFSFLLFFFS